MPVPADSIVRSTWRALLQPKRLIPILVVCLPLIATQVVWSGRAGPIALGIGLCLACVTVAPVAYRVLFPEGLDFSHGAVRLVLYGAVGAGVVLSLGVGVPKLLHMPPTFLTDRTSLAVSTALFLVGGWGLARDIGFEQRVARLEAEAALAQLVLLRSHLDPHFLFNTLNAIAEWCRTDGAVAETAVLKLSAMLRTLLEGERQGTWPLERELSIATTLLELHLLRDQSLFELQHIGEPPAIHVPALSILTLAENAVKHGAAKGHRGPLQLTVERNTDSVAIHVENEGPLQATSRDGGLGLATVHRQVALLKGSLRLSTPSPNRTRATLTIPYP